MHNEEKIIKILEEQSKALARIEKLLSAKKLQTSQFPIQKLPKSRKMSVSALLLLLKEDNFFNEPKTLNDISKKLEEESHNIPVTSLTMPLQRLVRGRHLGRIMRNGKWAYVKRD